MFAEKQVDDKRISLQQRIEPLILSKRDQYGAEDFEVFGEFKDALNRGEIRAAEKMEDGTWRVNTWVKHAILLGFRMGALTDMSASSSLRFFDKDTFPVRATTLKDNIRIVPGGSSVRDGVYLAPGVICMPPMYVNVGAYVDEATLIDSHALVGSCAQNRQASSFICGGTDWRRARTRRRDAGNNRGRCFGGRQLWRL